jgi:hypothetical protein
VAYEDFRNNEDGRAAEAEAARLEKHAVLLVKQYGFFCQGRRSSSFVNWQLF